MIHIIALTCVDGLFTLGLTQWAKAEMAHFWRQHHHSGIAETIDCGLVTAVGPLVHGLKIERLAFTTAECLRADNTGL